MTETIQWQELYRAAMLELDPIKLRQRIEDANEAIQNYREEIKSSNPTGRAEERQQMADALDNLRALLKVEFKSPSKTTDGGPSNERATL